MSNLRSKKDDIEYFLDNDLYLPTRTVYIGPVDTENHEVNAIMAERAIKNLHILDSISDNPITIIMLNYGGEVTAGMAIYDAIRLCRSYVTIKVFGCANSMGSIILQAADNRILAPNSEVMIHLGVTGYAEDHPLNIDNQHKRAREFDDWMINLYHSRIKEKKPRFKKSQVLELVKFDQFFTPDRAIEFGLADSIMESHKDD